MLIPGASGHVQRRLLNCGIVGGLSDGQTRLLIIAQGVGGGNFLVLIILAVWTQAARGRRGFAWTLIRLLDFLQMLFVYLLLIPLLAFNMAGGTFVPLPGQSPFPLQALAFGTLVAGLGLASLVYLYFEYRRVTRREALLAESRSTALQAR